MGFFGTYLYDGEQWHDAEPDSRPTDGGPWMLLDIHDSDFTIVTYDPAPRGAGIAYLGVTPRAYFEDPGASAPTDVFREAAGIAAWWAAINRAATDDALAKEEQIVTYLAADDTDVAALDDADVFVEIKTARFVSALGLPLPPDLDT